MGKWAVYQTEVQSNTIIEQIGSGNTVTFKVTGADGSKSFYGGVGAFDNTAFYITRFEDTNSNYISYHYFKPLNKSLCIDEIRFSANAISDIVPQNKIKFFYEQAIRTENTYIKGIKQEKTELLKKIEVYTGTYLFRQYLLTHIFDPQLGYQKVSKIQEVNGENDFAYPIEFEYNETVTTNVGTEKVKNYENNIDFQDGNLKGGDFDGDGRLDFIAGQKLYTKVFEGNQGGEPILLPAGTSIKSMVVTTKKDGKLNQFQSLLNQVENANSITFKTYSLIPNTNSVQLENTKTIVTDNSIECVMGCEISNSQSTTPCDGLNKTHNKYFEGDFNGDGISEILTLKFHETYIYQIDTSTCISDGSEIPSQELCPCILDITTISNSPEEILLVNLDQNSSSEVGTSGVAQITNLPLTRNTKEKIFINDYNGDGKSDILQILPDSDTNEGTNYVIYSFKYLNQSPWVQTEIIGSGIFDEYTSKKQLLFGDYNGDGKTDIMIPDKEGEENDYNNVWHIYYSNPKPTGGSFFTKETHTIVNYLPQYLFTNSFRVNRYFAMDTNRDGKTDLVRIWESKYEDSWWNDMDTEWEAYSYINNIGNSNSTNSFVLDYISPCANLPTHCHGSDHRDLPIPITATYRYAGLDREMVMVRNDANQIDYIDFTKDFQQDIRLTKVTSSDGAIVEDITYKEAVPSIANNGFGESNEFYSSENTVNFPLVEIKRLPGLHLVQKIASTVNGVSRYQDYKYQGYVTNMDGIGAVGFRKTAKSSWYTNTINPRIWSVIETDASLRGAVTRAYSQKVEEEAFSFTDQQIPTGIINSSENTYTTSTINGVYSILLQTNVSKDYLTDVSVETSYEYYEDYNLPKRITTSNYLSGVLQGKAITDNIYFNNDVVSDYYIGRPKETLTVTEAYDDTNKTLIKYSYTGSRLTKTEKQGNDANEPFLTEEFEYFNNGNLKKKTLSVPGALPYVAPRTTEYTYDESERFIKTTKDTEGLISTNDNYHPVFGLVTQSTNAFGISTSTIYDNWGKVSRITDYLGNKTFYYYTRWNGMFITNIHTPDGGESNTVTDVLGRVIAKGRLNVNNEWVLTAVEYDALGRKIREREPYFSTGSAAEQWTTYTYDDYGRVAQSEAPTGLRTVVTYDGLMTKTDDGTHAKGSLKNANGHVVMSSDEGGEITYDYFANGNVKSTNYSGTQITFEYDSWGRKKRMEDPSAGIYRYFYNAYGELTKEETPNGETSYTLDSAGKTIEKKIVGSHTNSLTTYTYNSVTKLPETTVFVDVENNSTTLYNYGYDSYNRIILNKETRGEVVFKREYAYDGLGRVEQELYSAKYHNTQQEKQIGHVYKYGYHWKLLDVATQQVLWELTGENAKGQTTGATYGNGITIENQFDEFGYPVQFKHMKQGATVMKINYMFDQELGNLKWRNTTLYGWGTWHESFGYDTMDRLTDYTDIHGDQVTQAYDESGRITENDQGQYSYDANKKYRVNKVDFASPAVKAYYEQRNPQQVSYNAFKAPVEIFEDGHERLSFEYNDAGNRAVMYYGSLAANKMERPLNKFYSTDGSMEIVYNTITHTLDFVTYIGGNGYSAGILLKGDGTNEKFYYLHRDYQGSILEVTSDDGGVVEKRLYDAWGNMSHYYNRLTNQTALPDASGEMFLDRGYTGHEHLTGVGLIHMNVRLYDPRLHRFLQPDNYVQEAGNTQNYNRYSYCLNNPLKYTDPSGELFWAAVGIAALIASAAYTISAVIFHTPFTVSGLLMSAAVGAFSGAVTFGIGSACETIGKFFTRATVQALSHGVFQGAMTGVQGGNFWSGFAAGSLSSIASSAFGQGFNYEYNADGSIACGDLVWKGAGSFASKGVGMVALGTVVGGASASLTGGNFWQGAVIGGMVSGLNHALHDHPNKALISKLKKEIKSLGAMTGDNASRLKRILTLDTFKKLQARAGGKVDVRYIYTESGLSSGGDEAYYTTIRADNGERYTGSNGGYINVFPASFWDGWSGLANNLVHEFGHAISRYTGHFANNYISNKKNWAVTIALDEVFAYDFQSFYGFSKFPLTTGFQDSLKILSNNNITINEK